MARETYDPFKDETIHQKKPRRTPVMIDWKRAARRFAEGVAPAVIAAELGIDEDRFWCHLHKSSRFRFLVARAAEQRQAAASLQAELAGPAAIRDRLQQPESLDAETLRALMAAPAVPDAGAMAVEARVEALATAGRPAPNMALRARLAAEKRRMDAQVVAMQDKFAARFPALGAETDRSETNANEAERALTNTNEAKRSESNANETDRNEADRPETIASDRKPTETATNARKPLPARTRPEDDNPWPGRPPRHLVPPPPEPRSRAALLGTITDLEGPDLARIRAMGGFDPPEIEAPSGA
jgi:hypothetical protein